MNTTTQPVMTSLEHRQYASGLIPTSGIRLDVMSDSVQVWLIEGN